MLNGDRSAESSSCEKHRSFKSPSLTGNNVCCMLAMVNRADRPEQDSLQERVSLPYVASCTEPHASPGKGAFCLQLLRYEELRAELEIPTAQISRIKSRMGSFFDKGICRISGLSFDIHHGKTGRVTYGSAVPFETIRLRHGFRRLWEAESQSLDRQQFSGSCHAFAVACK